ncbi:RES family NAD+ phosphorylase [Sphingomonas sp. MMS12-HWE2-04]|uniref:RES family NAD+ phosphorylase n=1 Tax=Sphingomonas sp. MMS12-HWE2-04 TaxID=3234199 RepID=UPI00384FA447
MRHFDPARLEGFAAPPARISGFSRIILAAHADTPTGVGFGTSRFSSPGRRFRVLYAAASFRTAFAEAVVRDRLEDRRRRIIRETTLEGYAITQIASTRPLKMLDLTGDNAYQLGLNTDAVRARTHQPGQVFAERLVAETDFDAIAYTSRLTGELCLAIFDRALCDIVGSPSRPLLTVAELSVELRRLKMSVRRAAHPQSRAR